jgi:hypothetical protein
MMLDGRSVPVEPMRLDDPRGLQEFNSYRMIVPLIPLAAAMRGVRDGICIVERAACSAGDSDPSEPRQVRDGASVDNLRVEPASGEATLERTKDRTGGKNETDPWW